MHCDTESDKGSMRWGARDSEFRHGPCGLGQLRWHRARTGASRPPALNKVAACPFGDSPEDCHFFALFRMDRFDGSHEQCELRLSKDGNPLSDHHSATGQHGFNRMKRLRLQRLPEIRQFAGNRCAAT